MRSEKIVWILAGVLFIGGCSDRGESPPDEGTPPGEVVAVPAPVSEDQVEAATPPARQEPRSYTALPDDFPEIPEPTPEDVRSVATAFQWAVVGQRTDVAKRRYRQLSALSGVDDRLRVACGLQLVHHCLGLDPPDETGAQAILDDLDEPVVSPAVPDALRAYYAWWRLIAHVAAGKQMLQGQQAAYEVWSDTLTHRAQQVAEVPIDVAPLLHALDRLARSSAMAGKPSTERMDEVLALVQGRMGRMLPGLLRAIQLRRVHLARREGNFADGLAGVRVLLALSTCDAAEWAEAVDLVQVVMRDAKWDEERIEQWRNYVRWGPAGEDGRDNTEDDALDLLATSVTSMAGSTNVASSLPAATHPQEPIEATVDSAFHCLLAGDGRAALERFSEALRQGPHDGNASWCLLDGVAMARVLCDGHLLGVEDAVAGSVDMLDEAASAAYWRYRLDAFRRQQDAMADSLIASGRTDLVLGLCRVVANRWDDPARGQRILKKAWEACRSLTGEEGAASELVCYDQFGGGLTTPEARVYRFYLAAEKCREAGDIDAALNQIRQIEPLWEHAVCEPAVVMLRATLLVRCAQSEEALPIVQQLVERPDVDEDHRTRARLLLGVIQVQQGESIEARRTLSELIEEKKADPRMRSYIRRASQILKQIGS